MRAGPPHGQQDHKVSRRCDFGASHDSQGHRLRSEHPPTRGIDPRDLWRARSRHRPAGPVVTDIRQLVRKSSGLQSSSPNASITCDCIAEPIGEEIPHLVVLHGGIKPKGRRAAITQLAEQPDNEPRLIIATGRYLGEGFDDPRLDTLLLTMPIAWKGTVVQYAGRLHRAHAAKRDIRIYDYVDSEVPVLRRMYAKRLRTYKEMGYVCDESAQELSLTM